MFMRDWISPFGLSGLSSSLDRAPYHDVDLQRATASSCILYSSFYTHLLWNCCAIIHTDACKLFSLLVILNYNYVTISSIKPMRSSVPKVPIAGS